MSAVVEVRGLEKTYATPAGPVPVLRGIDWSINPGEFCAITGPSGSGKTTLLNLVALLDTPDRGSFFFEGTDLLAAGESTRIHVRKHKIGMIFQKFCLLPHRTALENILFRGRYIEADRMEMRGRGVAIMDELGLRHLEHREARLLSGGEMQRVAIARALLIPPALLVADEPTGNLDRESARSVMHALQEINRKGIAVLLVTHNRALLEFATSHYECREGRLWREK